MLQFNWYIGDLISIGDRRVLPMSYFKSACFSLHFVRAAILDIVSLHAVNHLIVPEYLCKELMVGQWLIWDPLSVVSTRLILVDVSGSGVLASLRGLYYNSLSIAEDLFSVLWELGSVLPHGYHAVVVDFLTAPLFVGVLGAAWDFASQLFPDVFVRATSVSHLWMYDSFNFDCQLCAISLLRWNY